MKELLNKPVEVEYFVTKSVEYEVRAKILKPLEQHKFLKFFGLNKKYNLDHVKNF